MSGSFSVFMGMHIATECIYINKHSLLGKKTSKPGVIPEKTEREIREKCIPRRYWKDSDPLQMFIIVAAHTFIPCITAEEVEL